MKVTVIGTGYVGLVTGVVLAHLGNHVTCVEQDALKVEKLKRGESPIYEPGLDIMLREVLRSGHLSVSCNLSKTVQSSEVVMIAVGTPAGPDGAPDLTALRAVAHELAPLIKRYTVVVNKSTVPVGTGDLVADILIGHGIPRDLFDVVSNPEFLREGSALKDSLEPDRIVVGTESLEAASLMNSLYAPLGRPIQFTDVKSAELIKYASNAFLALKISYINAISRICESCGADVDEVALGMGSDRRIGPAFLNAGLGWGGSCFPKDVQGLIQVSQDHGHDFVLLKRAASLNDQQTALFVERLENRLGGFAGKTVALLGLAFKPNTDDIRDAKSLEVIRTIMARGGHVKACDPAAAVNVQKLWPELEICPDAYSACQGADAAMLVTEWTEYKNLDLKAIAGALAQPVFFDGRRCYDVRRAERAGLEYAAIGGEQPKRARLAVSGKAVVEMPEAQPEVARKAASLL